jgi:hypothetical protein
MDQLHRRHNHYLHFGLLDFDMEIQIEILIVNNDECNVVILTAISNNDG